MNNGIKTYVCHANNCLNNDGCGACNNDSIFVSIAVYDGQAVCPNYEPVCTDAGKAALAAGLLAEIKAAVETIDGEPLEEDLAAMEFCTDSDFVCFMCRPGGKYLQDFACDEGIACMIDCYNTLVSGKPSHCKPVV
ncbi:hypothetical protein KL86SPO_50217 [uncultured Sporomusa sp.]|uniref:Uncharacterized protein n=1 Tax=uncultured Sporomusa sp. TaxID=307249 RepID=A0A212LY52_9FIRM|nr:hypothetical protein [uncultured Sporomusa sp.]SCM82446.1 hypothetical protein KL86SPO_50217 [uncultured Sporomusa sp.]